MNPIPIFALILFNQSVESKVHESPCKDWTPFRDEKCFKIIDHDALKTHEDAERACSKLDAHLPVIQSREEQNFLTNFLFKTHKKMDNFWIGAKIGVNNSFEWNDYSKVTFANWSPSKGHSRSTNFCVQIEAPEDHESLTAGRWLDEPCQKHYGVVCQKMQNWSIERLVKSHFETRKELSDSLDSANKKIEDLERKLQDSIKNTIPIGFIYAQIPFEKSPTELWPSMTWMDISSTYSGLFFRILGTETESFGAVQQESYPKIVGFTTFDDGPRAKNFHEKRESYTKISDTRRTSFTWLSGIKFDIENREVRPRNMAIRVWKRIA